MIVKRKIEAEILARAYDYSEMSRHCKLSTAVTRGSRGWRRLFRKTAMKRLRRHVNCENVDSWSRGRDYRERCSALWGASFV